MLFFFTLILVTIGSMQCLNPETGVEGCHILLHKIFSNNLVMNIKIALIVLFNSYPIFQKNSSQQQSQKVKI